MRGNAYDGVGVWGHGVGWLLRTLPSLTSWLLILDWQMLEKCWKSGDKVLHNQHCLKILQNLDANCPPHFIHLTRPGCCGVDLELMPYQARMFDQIGKQKFVFVYLRVFVDHWCAFGGTCRPILGWLPPHCCRCAPDFCGRTSTNSAISAIYTNCGIVHSLFAQFVLIVAYCLCDLCDLRR